MISNTVADALKKLNYVKLPFNDPRTYSLDERQYRTYTKDGIIMAISRHEYISISSESIPVYCDGDKHNITIHFLRVDEELRGCGRAKAALKDIAKIADNQDLTIYVMIPANKLDVDPARLIALYRLFSFELDPSTSFMVRHPKA